MTKFGCSFLQKLRTTAALDTFFDINLTKNKRELEIYVLIYIHRGKIFIHKNTGQKNEVKFCSFITKFSMCYLKNKYVRGTIH